MKKMKPEMGVMLLQAKTRQRLPANHQEPGERHSPQKEPGSQDFQLPELRENTFLLFNLTQSVLRCYRSPSKLMHRGRPREACICPREEC